MNRTKADWQKRVWQKLLDNLMIISEKRPSVDDINPDHAINTQYGKKMQRVGGETSHEFQKRGQEQTQEQSI